MARNGSRLPRRGAAPQDRLAAARPVTSQETDTTTGEVVVFDDLDRRIIAELQTDGRASWTEIAQRCTTSVTTVARRAQHLLDDGTVRVAVVPDINSRGPADLFVLRIGCAVGAAMRVASELARRDDIRFLAIVTGSNDIVAELVAHKDDTLHSRLVKELPAIDGVQRCETDLLLHTYKVSHDWSREILDDRPPAGDTEPHRCDPTHFDDTDRALLAVLREGGRANFRTVAKEVGVDDSTIRRRFETLRARGCVQVVTLVPAPALGLESEILFWISVSPPALVQVAQQLATYQGVRYLGITLSGSQLMCEVILPSSHDVFQFTTEVLGKLEGIVGWTANMELLTIKRGFVTTPWAETILTAAGALTKNDSTSISGLRQVETTPASARPAQLHRDPAAR